MTPFGATNKSARAFRLVPRPSRYDGTPSAAVPHRQALSPYHRRVAVNGTSITDLMIVVLMVFALVSIFTISTAMLTNWKIHYLTEGGSFYEKLHPATYFTFLSLGLLLLRNSDPIGEANRILSESKLILFYFLSWTILLVQTFLLERPFTFIIDTFLLPVLLCLIIWRLSPSQRRPLVWALHLTILLNVALGYYEYFSGHRLIPLTVGNLLVLGEWRSAAFLGHPLTASGLVAGYVLALLFRPAICPPLLLRLPLIAFCAASLMVFGGRTALMTVLAVIACATAMRIFRFLRGSRISVPAALVTLCVFFATAAIVVAALDSGIFDKMLLRFSSDKGSALARFATFHFLSHFDWHELLLGPNSVRVNALQSQLGLTYGIENFWIACIAQVGIIMTALLTLALVALFAEILQRSSQAAWAIAFLVLMIAASSVSFSSKNIQLAQFVVLITLLLPREQAPAASPARRSNNMTAYPPR